MYVSDAPGQHDIALLQRLVLPDGTILRALRPGRPTRDTLFRNVLSDGKSLLKARFQPPDTTSKLLDGLRSSLGCWFDNGTCCLAKSGSWRGLDL